VELMDGRSHDDLLAYFARRTLAADLTATAAALGIDCRGLEPAGVGVASRPAAAVCDNVRTYAAS
jgi:hypothetical protein